MDFGFSTIELAFTLLLLLASWFAGYFSHRNRNASKSSSPDADYFIGLNFLLNDEADDAIDVFINALEINANTFDTHLALGMLLRRRGKVDRSIKHYQALLASPEFSSRQLSAIKLQLVRSYIASGLLDRAEKFLEELTQSDPAVREVALELAITVFQTEKEWSKALDSALELLKICSLSQNAALQLKASHFYCEIAESDFRANNYVHARDCLHQAAKQCRQNIRVDILQIKVEVQIGNSKNALEQLQRLLLERRKLAPIVLQQLQEILDSNGLADELRIWMMNDQSRQFLQEAWSKVFECRDEAFARSRLDQLTSELEIKPSLQKLHSLLGCARQEGGVNAPLLTLVERTVEAHLQATPNFRCESCGFELKNQHWCCPGCHQWGQVFEIEPVSYTLSPVPKR